MPAPTRPIPLSSSLPDAPRGESDLFDSANPQAIINLVSPVLQDRMREALKKRPDLFQLDERELYQKLLKEKFLPTPTDNRIRMKFWIEYDRCLGENIDHMTMANVYGNVCSKEFFNSTYVKRPEKIAWLLTAPASYQVITEEALIFGIDNMRDILEMSHMVKVKNKRTGQFERDPVTGEIEMIPDYKMIEIKAKIVMMLDQRVKGAATQRIEQKTMSLHLGATEKDVHEVGAGNNMEMLQNKLKKLEALERALMNGGSGMVAQDIVVESTTIEESPSE